LIDFLHLLQTNLLLICKVLSRGIMVCIIFKIMGMSSINWYQNHNLLLYPHEYFCVSFISFKNLMIDESDFIDFFHILSFLL
jgi:hypothetical protein